MDKENFKKILKDAVQEYIDNFDRFDSNPQIRINPESLTVALVNGSDMIAEIEDSDEAVEDAAHAQGMADQEASDYQVKQNPDFYPVKKLLQPKGNSDIPSGLAIERILIKYFPQ